MCTYGYTAEISNLDPTATENDVYDFFLHCGLVENVEITRYDGYASSAFVTFRDAYGLETALLLNGSIIIDQCVCISRYGPADDDFEQWNNQDVHANKFISVPGEAVTVAQEVVKTMASKGYVLGKDALIKAKALDERYHVSSSAGAKVAELSSKIGLTDAIHSGMETFKSVDEKFHVLEITKSAATVTGTAAIVLATVTGKAAVAAGTAVVNSSYFSKGALWVSDVLHRASKAAADVGSQTNK